MLNLESVIKTNVRNTLKRQDRRQRRYPEEVESKNT
jgi:hypothetical protein